MTEQTKTLREAKNKVELEGLVNEVKIEEKEVKGKEAIMGTIDIKVAENEVHSVRVFSYKQKKDGTENGIYKGLKTIKDEVVSVAKAGNEGATKVRINNGSISVNEFFNRNDELVSNPQIKTNFINRVKDEDEYSPQARFELELVVSKVIPEFKNNEETGRMKISGWTPIYGGKVIPVELVVTEEGSPFVEDNFTKGSTVFVYGEIVNFREETIRTIEMDFGEPKEERSVRYNREMLVTGGSLYDPELDSKKIFDLTLIKKALTQRERDLEDKKNEKKEDKEKERNTFTGGKKNTAKAESMLPDDINLDDFL